MAYLRVCFICCGRWNGWHNHAVILPLVVHCCRLHSPSQENVSIYRRNITARDRSKPFNHQSSMVSTDKHVRKRRRNCRMTTGAVRVEQATCHEEQATCQRYSILEQ